MEKWFGSEGRFLEKSMNSKRALFYVQSEVVEDFEHVQVSDLIWEDRQY